MNHEETHTLEVEETEDAQQPRMTFSIEIVDADEQPAEWGGRYKRPGQQPRPRSRDRALNKGEFGKAEDLQAVFDSRAAYLQENPKPETHREINEDSRNLGHVLPDFPGVHDFVFEMETVRMKALDRLIILQENQDRLKRLSHQVEANEIDKDEILKQLQQITSSFHDSRRQVAHLSEQLDLEAPPGAPEKRFSLLEIGAEMGGIGKSAVSMMIGKMRHADAKKPEAEWRIKTPKGGQLTRPEIKELKVFASTKVPRPNARKRKPRKRRVK